MSSTGDIIRNITEGRSSAHAYIVEGRSATNRTEFINRLAMGLECLEAEAAERPCGRCASCRQIAAGSSMDVVRMQMSGKTAYRTEDANAFAERLDMGAYGRFLIGIIDDADSLSEVVQNKLLKTLEEPRESVLIFMGSSNPDHLLSTVRSRCSVIRMPAVAAEDAEDEADAAKIKAIKELSAMYVTGTEAFYRVRESIEKNIRSRADAVMLIEETEKSLAELMRSGDEPQSRAEGIEKCELAAADMERGMDRARALKRLYLEMKD